MFIVFNVTSLINLPRKAELRREMRDDYTVTMVSGVRARRTRQMVIIAGPVNSGRHGFITIYPGEYCPPFYDGTFWETHGFIVHHGKT